MCVCVRKRTSKMVYAYAVAESNSVVDAMCMEVRFKQHLQIKRKAYQTLAIVRKSCADRIEVGAKTHLP